MIGPLAYIGGKRRLARHIASLIPPHVTYVEPFCGGAQVFFHKTPSRVEVLNDLNGDVVNFLRVCQHHHAELVRSMAYVVASRATFAQYLAQDPAYLTDVQRAARFLFLQKNAFGGQVRRRAYHYCVTKPANFNPQTLPRIIASAAERLSRVQVEQWPYERVLERYDRPTTFFYLDPPYVGLKLYTANMADADYATLAARLGSISGRFLLSINDHPVARRAFIGFHSSSRSIAYTAGRHVPVVTELLISNFETVAEKIADPATSSMVGCAKRGTKRS